MTPNQLKEVVLLLQQPDLRENLRRAAERLRHQRVDPPPPPPRFPTNQPAQLFGQGLGGDFSYMTGQHDQYSGRDDLQPDRYQPNLFRQEQEPPQQQQQPPPPPPFGYFGRQERGGATQKELEPLPAARQEEAAYGRPADDLLRPGASIWDDGGRRGGEERRVRRQPSPEEPRSRRPEGGIWGEEGGGAPHGHWSRRRQENAGGPMAHSVGGGRSPSPPQRRPREESLGGDVYTRRRSRSPERRKPSPGRRRASSSPEVVEIVHTRSSVENRKESRPRDAGPNYSPTNPTDEEEIVWRFGDECQRSKSQ